MSDDTVLVEIVTAPAAGLNCAGGVYDVGTQVRMSVDEAIALGDLGRVRIIESNDAWRAGLRAHLTTGTRTTASVDWRDYASEIDPQ